VSMSTHWEYKLEASTHELGALAGHLNDESAEGWELVTVIDADSDDAGRSLLLIYRRELTNPTWEKQGD